MSYPKVAIIIPHCEKYDHFYAAARDSAGVQSIAIQRHTVSRRNVAAATNEGVGHTECDYILRLDCDDMLHPDACLVMSNYLDNHPEVAAVYSDYYEMDEEGTPGELIFQHPPPHPGCMMIRRSVYEEIGGFDESLVRQEGTEFYYRLSRDHRVFHITLPLWRYRRHDQQMSNAHNEVIQARHAIKEQHVETTKILAVIPARGGSKGIPRKNLVKLDGMPLVVHAINLAKKSAHDMMIAVSTEDRDIARVAFENGVDVIKRSQEDAQDEVSTITVAKHGMEATDPEFRADIVISIQPTGPYTPVEALDVGIDRMLAHPALDAMVSMTEVTGTHPYRMYYNDAVCDQYLPFFPDESELYLQRQDRPAAYRFTGGFYIRRRRLLEGWGGDNFCLGEWEGVLVPPQTGIDIDTPMDLWLAQAISQHWEEI